jgi:alpha-methylacyl-CoA racemase
LKRVVSLVPSITETLMAWGVRPVAVTRFCEVAGLPTVGGTKNPETATIISLEPDVVLMDKEENRIEDAVALEEAGLAVVATQVRSLNDVAPALSVLAAAAGIEPPAAAAAAVSPPEPFGGRRYRVFVPIWRRPWMTIGGGVYGTSILAAAGFDNILTASADPYPHLDLEAAAALEPELVLAPSEPYPFAERHRRQLEAVAPVEFVDGRDLFWWGARTPAALNRLRHLAPGVSAGMMLADMGAEVVRIDRSTAAMAATGLPAADVVGRGRKSVGVDLKHPDGKETVLKLVEKADALIEGYRPGVTERLGLGPVDCLARNPRLVYGRMTGWGQEGPYAPTAGHDINYIALSGTLDLIGRQGQPPTPPLNLVGDFGGGGMLLAFGVVCALLETTRSGQGQVIDAAMVDGSAILAAMIHGFRSTGTWGERGTNMLDSGAWFYDVYETSDARYISLGSIEPQFLQEMLRLTGLADDGHGELPHQHDRATWPAMKERLGAVIRTKTMAEWMEIMEGSDACFAPVLTPEEAAAHPHNAGRGTFVTAQGVLQPAPAPRFSRTAPAIAGPPARPGEHTDATLMAWGFGESEVAELREAGAIA